MSAPSRRSVFWSVACVTIRAVYSCIAIPCSGYFIHYVDMEKTRRDTSLIEIPYQAWVFKRLVVNNGFIS
jgi:hypothetical protein